MGANGHASVVSIVNIRNNLEKWYLYTMSYNVSVKPSQYTKAYFELNQILQQSTKMSKPLTIGDVQRFEVCERLQSNFRPKARKEGNLPSIWEKLTWNYSQILTKACALLTRLPLLLLPR